MQIWRENMEGKDFKLSRDYARAWELIQQGEKLACEYDRSNSRVVTRAEKSASSNTVVINGWSHYLPSGFNGFAKRCTELNFKFYLPIADNYTNLLIETQPQVITNDAQNDANLAHIERLMVIENLTPEEEKILDLLLLLSKEFEENFRFSRSKIKDASSTSKLSKEKKHMIVLPYILSLTQLT